MSDKITYSIGDVSKVVNAALTKIGKENASTGEKLYKELNELAELIHGICDQISGSKETIHSGKGDITKATSELTEVVSATEHASGVIMDSCEVIQNIAETVDDATSQKLMDETARIFEACSFQDITGQRINNAVKSLVEIEQRIDHLIEILNKDGRFNVSHAESEDSREGDERLKNGPQMSNQAMSQEDIDKLLAD